MRRTGRRPLSAAARAALQVGVLIWILAAPAALAGQVHRYDVGDWTGDVAIGAANVLLGAVAGGVRAWIGGTPIPEAFLGGAVGGGVLFVGKRLVVERFDGAGLLGRQVGAVGSSIVANAGRGAGWLDEVWLPLGPSRVQVSPRSPLAARVHAFDLGATIWAVARPELALDWTATLSNGTPIFRAGEHRIVGWGNSLDGLAMGGVVLVGPTPRSAVLGHEMVHVVQHDFTLAALDRPLEGWLWDRLGVRPPVEIGVGFIPVWLVARGLVEGEAYELDGEWDVLR